MPIAITILSMIATYFAGLLTVARAIRNAGRRLSDRFDRIAPGVVIHGPAASLDDACGTQTGAAPDAGVWSVAPIWQTPVLAFAVESECRFDVHSEVVESILPIPATKPAKPAKRVAARQTPETVIYDRRAELETMSMVELRAIATPHGIRGNSKAMLVDRLTNAGF